MKLKGFWNHAVCAASMAICLVLFGALLPADASAKQPASLLAIFVGADGAQLTTFDK